MWEDPGLELRGTEVLGSPYLQQYHTLWHLEQRLEASALQ